MSLKSKSNIDAINKYTSFRSDCTLTPTTSDSERVSGFTNSVNNLVKIRLSQGIISQPNPGCSPVLESAPDALVNKKNVSNSSPMVYIVSPTRLNVSPNTRSKHTKVTSLTHTSSSARFLLNLNELEYSAFEKANEETNSPDRRYEIDTQVDIEGVLMRQEDFMAFFKSKQDSQIVKANLPLHRIPTIGSIRQ